MIIWSKWNAIKQNTVSGPQFTSPYKNYTCISKSKTPTQDIFFLVNWEYFIYSFILRYTQKADIIIGISLWLKYKWIIHIIHQSFVYNDYIWSPTFNKQMSLTAQRIFCRIM